MTIEEATDTEIFLAYLEHVLCPQLRSGDVVVSLATDVGPFVAINFGPPVAVR
jgi:hypothetical protein